MILNSSEMRTISINSQVVMVSVVVVLDLLVLLVLSLWLCERLRAI